MASVALASHQFPLELPPPLAGTGVIGHAERAMVDRFLTALHGSDGRLLGQEVAGQGSWGERFYRLQYPIHGGRIAGLPGRIAIAALGLAIAGLSLTGVYIWWRKRRARHWNGR